MSQEVSGLVQGPGAAGSRAQESRQPEPAGEDQPEPKTVTGMSSQDVEQRSRLGRFITMTALPGDRDVLIANARENQAPADLIAELERLPEDTRYRTVSEVWAALAAQRHRRVIKTHTPLDGVPIDGRVTYVVVARHPLDAAVSLYHQGDNIDRTRLRALTGSVASTGDGPRPPADEWLRASREAALATAAE